MSTTTTSPAPDPPAAPSRVRAPFVVGAAVLALVGLALGAVGGVALWADSHKDRDGYLTTATERFTAGSHALATERLDVDRDAGRLLRVTGGLGRVRVVVRSDRAKPVFVGVGRSRDVARYLGGVPHRTLTDVETDPFRASYRDEGGTHPPAPPASRSLWTASSTGVGRQTLAWKMRAGDWSVVVMNADGSRGVSARASAGAQVPHLATIGWVGVGLGGLALAGAAGLGGLASRRR
jgi:hypothetical protein